MKLVMSLKSSICRTFQLLRSTVASAFAGTRKRNAALPWLVALAFTLTAQQGHACTFNVTGVNFGSYDVFSNAASDSTGNIDVNCPSGVGYTIGLSAGNGSYEQRGMSNGTHTLNYNLYTAANREFVWEDATTSGATVSGSGTGMNINHVVYGRIPPRQNVRAGNYTDTVNLIINF